MKKKVPISAFSFESTVTVGEETNGAHSVKLEALSGDPLNHWYWGNVVMDISGMTHKDKVMIDWCHDGNVEMGFVDEFDKSVPLSLGGKLISLEKGDRSDRVVSLSEQGVPYEASIHFPSSKPGDTEVEELGFGESDVVNGQEVQGPITIFRKWPLRRVAICPSGADSDTAAMFKEQNQEIEVEIMDKEKKEQEEPKAPVEEKKEEPKAEEFKAPTEREEFKKFTSAFGEELGVKYFGEGKTMEEAQSAFNEDSRKRIADLEKQLNAKPETKEDKPVKFSGDGEGDYNDYWTDKDEASVKAFCANVKGADFEKMKAGRIALNKRKQLARAS